MALYRKVSLCVSFLFSPFLKDKDHLLFSFINDRILLYTVDKCYLQYSKAGNSLIGFPSESLVFCSKMSEWAIHSRKRVIHSFSHHFCWVTWAICSRSLISSERCEWIVQGRSFLVSNLSDLLTSLIFVKRPERFTHITHQKWAICSFLK